MTTDPTPQQDHGAAGFCTDHAQAADTIEIARVLAQVLLDHQPGEGYPWEAAWYGERIATCWCGWETPPEFFSWRLCRWHRKHVTVHLAAAVAAYLAGERT